ncbi:mannosyl-3-phosphoglycerate synthase [Candidatus Bathyarchaeota archaeon]|nr:MAG: mannosyl-3-phosphoglycerate synthase [Candidatus Bathyarchaeota archaeon]
MVRIEIPRYTERFGSVRINDVQRVIELDSGVDEEGQPTKLATIHRIDGSRIRAVEKRFAVVIPIKEEKLKLLEGVLSGIPHGCSVIIVSNSPRSPIDRFKMERDLLVQYYHFAERPLVLIHQKDRVLAEAFAKAKYPEILDEEGFVADGKAEGMIVGLLFAKLMGKDFVGFVDADNYVPGAVHEYIKIFCSGFNLAKTPYSMVRISWVYKPKISEVGLYFKKWGRISEYTNKFINLIIASYTGFETEIVKTGSSGEHALTMKLAELMPFSSGFSLEPFEILWLLEEFGGVKPTSHRDVMDCGVEVFQVETRNPHFHEEKGDTHLQKMLLVSLGIIYHNSLCNSSIKQSIKNELTSVGILKADQEPPKPKIYPPISKLDLETFRQVLEKETDTLLKLD